MCPDKNILSAYFDGELDTRWNLEVEAHVAECDSCKSVLADFRVVSDTLASQEELSIEGRSIISAWNVLQAHMAVAFPGPVWKRRFQVPIPVFAFLTLLVIALSIGLVMSLFSQKSYDPFNTVSRTLLEGRELSSVDEILNYLDTRGEGGSFTFQLPQDTKLRLWSEPTLIRAADYHRGRD